MTRSRLSPQPGQMKGKGISMEQPQPRACSGGKTLRMCRNKGGTGTDNVVLIDVDSDNYNNVIIIDVPEFLPRSLRGSSSNGLRKDKNYSLATVICIDDDDDENTGNNNSDGDQFVQGNNAPVKLSKCKRTYSGKASTSNRYGSRSDSETGSSDDDDGLDFEFEGSSGKLKEQWEKAFLKRQNDILSGGDQAETSRFCTESHQDIDTQDQASASQFCTDDNQDGGIGKETNENSSLGEKNDALNSQSGLGHTGNDSVFFNREMLKQTDEYKRSIAEELASRKRELQIQAEEAQRLKRLQKRKNAESMRVLDMERRQKQRVEEMRETQKKDEQNLNMKEQLRAEVRKQLSRLEMCNDMASVLCGLGIKVTSPNEVRIAFKRALLSFHPDRASQSDIRQQVEAEEKFKLITRMKEKLLPTL